jgi:hypothetical protein
MLLTKVDLLTAFKLDALKVTEYFLQLNDLLCLFVLFYY